MDSLTAASAAVGAFLVALAAIVARVWKHWRPLIRKVRSELAMGNRYQIDHRTREALAEFADSSEAARALLLQAENCGWETMSGNVTVSVRSESVRGEGPRVFERWQGWVADPPYVSLLHDVFNARNGQRAVLLVTEEMPDGILRDYYQETGVAASVVFFVKVTSYGAMLYVSLNFGRLHSAHEDVPKAECDAEVEKARQFFAFPERVRRKVVRMLEIWKDV